MVATLAVAALVVASALAATLSHAEVRRTGTNHVIVEALIGTLSGTHEVCQRGERIPAGTETIRVSLVPGSEPDAEVTLAVEANGGAAAVATARGHRWDGNTALLTLSPRVTRDVVGRVCMTIRTPRQQEVGLFGRYDDTAPSATDGRQTIGGRLRFDYLQAGSASWWAFASTVIDRLGLGHAWSGTSVALLAVLLMSTSIGLAAWLLVRSS